MRGGGEEGGGEKKEEIMKKGKKKHEVKRTGKGACARARLRAEREGLVEGG